MSADNNPTPPNSEKKSDKPNTNRPKRNRSRNNRSKSGSNGANGANGANQNREKPAQDGAKQSPQQERNNRNRRSGRQRDRRKKKPSNRISEHFSKRDFACKCGECTKSFRISLGLIGALEMLRNSSEKRITIHKGYECQESKEKSGNFRRNHFTTGIAALITVDDMSIIEAFKLCEEIPEIKGLGADFKLNMVYLDTRKEDERSSWVISEDGSELKMSDDVRKKYLAD
ncbi:hypothetical protein HOH87_02560 [bacterium]|jgi:hypothetical protein|nr:hypothetical protein [bacterium]